MCCVVYVSCVYDVLCCVVCMLLVACVVVCCVCCISDDVCRVVYGDWWFMYVALGVVWVSLCVLCVCRMTYTWLLLDIRSMSCVVLFLWSVWLVYDDGCGGWRCA